MIGAELVTVSNAISISGRSKLVLDCLVRRGIVRTVKRGLITLYNQSDLKLLKIKFK